MFYLIATLMIAKILKILVSIYDIQFVRHIEGLKIRIRRAKLYLTYPAWQGFLYQENLLSYFGFINERNVANSYLIF